MTRLETIFLAISKMRLADIQPLPPFDWRKSLEDEKRMEAEDMKREIEATRQGED